MKISSLVSGETRGVFWADGRIRSYLDCRSGQGGDSIPSGSQLEDGKVRSTMARAIQVATNQYVSDGCIQVLELLSDHQRLGPRPGEEGMSCIWSVRSRRYRIPVAWLRSLGVMHSCPGRSSPGSNGLH